MKLKIINNDINKKILMLKSSMFLIDKIDNLN